MEIDFINHYLPLINNKIKEEEFYSKYKYFFQLIIEIFKENKRIYKNPINIVEVGAGTGIISKLLYKHYLSENNDENLWSVEKWLNLVKPDIALLVDKDLYFTIKRK